MIDLLVFDLFLEYRACFPSISVTSTPDEGFETKAENLVIKFKICIGYMSSSSYDILALVLGHIFSFYSNA